MTTLQEQLAVAPINDRKKELIEKLVAQQETINKLLYQKGKEDLYIFNKYILDVEQGKQELVQFHKELCRFVTDNKQRKKLILIPRGHLKSTLITIGYSVQQIVNNPNIRILILNATWQMAVDFLTEIKRHISSNERLIDLYGLLGNKETAEEWSQDRILLKRTDTNIKGPTVWATGIESNLTGSHPDLIIMDDVMNRDMVASRDQIEKVILRYKDALDLLEPGGQLIVIGTRWADADFYSWLMDKEQDHMQSYDVMIRKAYEGNLETGEDFKALWPEKFTQEELLSRLKGKGWYEFSAQYMNNPVPMEDADFKREWFQYFDLDEFKGKEMRTVITVDPAISLAKDADFTAMSVVGIDTFSNLFIKDLVRAHMKPSTLIDTLFTLNDLWHPQMIIVETIAYQKALAYALRDEMRSRGKFLPIYEINQQERSKDQRIRGLQPVYMNKKVFHRKDHPLTAYLEEELLRFPRARHDDMADSLSMALDYLTPPRQKKKRYHHRYLY